MNRYPLWKYAILLIALVVGLVYTLPNLFGEAPAVQVSSGKVTVKLDPSLAPRIEEILAKAGLKADFVQYDGNSVKARFADLDAQRKAKDAISAALNPDPSDPTYIVALNLLSRSPRWLTALHALPMYLGLDLRGGVHFLMQVDMKAALTKKADSTAGDVRTLLRDKNIRHTGIARDGNGVVVRFRDQRDADGGAHAARRPADRLRLGREPRKAVDFKLAGNLKPDAAKRVQDGGDHAEHHDPAQPRQRARRRRAGDPAAGRRPRRRPAAGRAGHGQGEGHHRPHRDARDAHGRREQRGAHGGDRRRPGAVRHRALRRARRPAAHRQAPGAAHRREPDRRAARLRRPERRSRPST